MDGWPLEGLELELEGEGADGLLGGLALGEADGIEGGLDDELELEDSQAANRLPLRPAINISLGNLLVKFTISLSCSESIDCS